MVDKKQKKESSPQQSYRTIDVIMADNLVNNDTILADNVPDTELLLADKTFSNELLLADSITIQSSNVANSSTDTEDRQADNFVKVEIPEKLYISELEARFKIKRATLYERLKYLNITPWKEGKKAYLDAEQIGHMDGLREHMKNNNVVGMRNQTQPAS